MVSGVLLDIAGALSEGGLSLHGAVKAVERLRERDPHRFVVTSTPS